MEIAFWILWFAAGMILVGLVIAILLPTLLLKADGATYKVRDRALGSYNLKDGVTFLYEPSPSASKYIGKYQIYQTEKGKFFLGEWAQEMSYADYDLYVYNAKNSLKSVLNVKEKKVEGTLTRATKLPDDADFVSVKFNRANTTAVRSEKKFSWKFVLIVLLFSLVTALAVDALLWLVTTFVVQCLDGFPAVSQASFEIFGELFGYIGSRITLIIFVITFLWAFFTRREVKRRGK